MNNTEEEMVSGLPKSTGPPSLCSCGRCNGMCLHGRKGGFKGSHNVEASLC